MMRPVRGSSTQSWPKGTPVAHKPVRGRIPGRPDVGRPLNQRRIPQTETDSPGPSSSMTRTSRRNSTRRRRFCHGPSGPPPADRSDQPTVLPPPCAAADRTDPARHLTALADNDEDPGRTGRRRVSVVAMTAEYRRSASRPLRHRHREPVPPHRLRCRRY